MKIFASGITDVGCVRENNEDAYTIRQDLPLFVVADGVGGAAAGEVASRLFVTSCEYEFGSMLTEDPDIDFLITRCFQNANKKILNHMEQHPETKGMACTAEVLTINKNKYTLGHVGDSRTYLIRENEITQITKDHSYIQEQMDLGLLAPDEAKNHWLKNAIYRAIGIDEDVQVDRIHGHVKNGDVFLLCSDGLSDLVAEQDMLQVVLSSKNLQKNSLKLVEMAKQLGGKDNITVVLCQILEMTPIETVLSHLNLATIKTKFSELIVFMSSAVRTGWRTIKKKILELVDRMHS